MINYLLSHKPHGPYLVVSIMTLRRYHPSMPIRIHAWKMYQADELAYLIALDPRLGPIEVVIREPRWTGHDGYLFDKIALMEDNPDPGILIDADSMITGNVGELLRLANDNSFVAAQFCNHTIHQQAIKRRLGILREQFAGSSEVDVTIIDAALATGRGTGHYKGLNVGVFASAPGNAVLPEWYRWTMHCRDSFIPDEMCLNLLQAKFVPTGQMVVVDGRYNASPKDWRKPPQDVRIWHGHGNCFTKKGKSPRAAAMWRPEFEKALSDNLGNMQNWIEECQNKHIPECKYDGR